MKPLVSFLAMLGVCLSVGFGQPGSIRVTVENPGKFVREHETVEIPLRWLTIIPGAGKARYFLVRESRSKAQLVTQVTDEELLFQSDFAPGERKEFIVTQSVAGDSTIPSLVDGRFVPPREDYAWENDRIAFRMYGPALAAEVNNGIDVWTKRVRSLIVAKWYKESESAPPGKDTYHQDRGEGADFFEVGRSLGAGGSGIWHNGKVHQPGVFTSYKTLCNGPIRVSFELTYKGWNVDGRTLVEHKRISLDAGQFLNRIDVRFEGQNGSEPLQIAAGLVKRANTTLKKNPAENCMGLWGLTNADSANGSLGTAIVFVSRGPIRYTEDSTQYLMIGQIRAERPFTYYAGAGWTRNSDFGTGNDWNKYLVSWARNLRSPLKVSVKATK